MRVLEAAQAIRICRLAIPPLVKVPIEDIAEMVTDRVAFIDRVKAFHAGKRSSGGAMPRY
jgi:hypothetical protein